MKHTRKNAFT